MGDLLFYSVLSTPTFQSQVNRLWNVPRSQLRAVAWIVLATIIGSSRAFCGSVEKIAPLLKSGGAACYGRHSLDRFGAGCRTHNLFILRNTRTRRSTKNSFMVGHFSFFYYRIKIILQKIENVNTLMPRLKQTVLCHEFLLLKS